MYQTVGHKVIPLYEQALGVPLYRQEITGKAVNSNRDYELVAQQEQDETEDLVPLLRRVMQAHPEANAVSTGAILSTYQRTRVESVALRLSLTPLSFLWQYPLLPPYSQSSLLHDMASVGQYAVIIKTASGGLDESFLGLDVANQKTIAKLSKTMGRFGEASNGAIVGEGGEFETLALNGPRSLWKRRIKILSSSSKALEGGQTVLAIDETALQDNDIEDEEPSDALRIPHLLDVEFKSLLDAVEAESNDHTVPLRDETIPNEREDGSPVMQDILALEGLPTDTYSDTPTVFTHSNLISDKRTSTDNSPSQQTTNILLRLDHILKQWHLLKANINHCTLLLRSMTDFTVLNPIYGQYFSDVNPPARATIAIGDTMPEGVDVMLSIILDKDEKDRKGKPITSINRQGLHIQSRSYWAPANIGPYSQAILVRLPPAQPKTDDEQQQGGEIVYVAGQIPLVPASMQAYNTHGFTGQALLSLQHLWRIGRAKNVRWWTAAVAFTPASEAPEEHVRIAQDLWKRVHVPPALQSLDDNDDDEDENENEEPHIDPWDRLNRTTAPAFNDSTYRAPIPDLSAVSSPANPGILPVPPCFVAQVSSLPCSVGIEWSATGLTSSSIQFSRNITFPQLTLTSPQNTRSRFYTLQIRDAEDVQVLQRLGEDSVAEWTSAVLYVGRGFVWGDMVREGLVMRGVQWVPCLKVWGEGGREVRGVLVGRVDREVEVREKEDGKGVLGMLRGGLRRTRT
ncbi:meiotically up-regulated gene 71 protein [Setomelanomma holmii]|uniref:Diphthine--ammonia ligase n=1 Tax=Setomelanomma holmii TaxID=210430 RepID=A0A9P4HIL9_9PLEO|nr:meiotically up-regulated gene 71 protein [Setomelanomma holmii]